MRTHRFATDQILINDRGQNSLTARIGSWAAGLYLMLESCHRPRGKGETVRKYNELTKILAIIELPIVSEGLPICSQAGEARVTVEISALTSTK
jgi:hypothetical protein